MIIFQPKEAKIMCCFGDSGDNINNLIIIMMILKVLNQRFFVSILRMMTLHTL